jgi:tetraacyldisaccharide 4'-kinase
MNPLTGLYSGATALRNTLFDRGILKSQRLRRPVISVGNLSVGGSGKTPFVIALGELLKTRGIQFDVLTRGYGRRTRGVLLVDPKGEASEFGDEPLLIARRLGVPVVVGENRYDAGRVAEEKFESQFHILDDGFQHRSLARDFDIVLLSQRDLDDGLLPSGRLREPLSSLQRADAIAVHENPAKDFSNKLTIKTGGAQGKLIWRTEREFAAAEAPREPIVFCGIARPQQFFAHVRGAGLIPAAELTFGDHHRYTRADVERLMKMRDKHSAGGFLTTEKDAINLGSWRDRLRPLAVASLNLRLDHPDDIIDAILGRIANRKPQS